MGLDVYFRRDIANVLRATACANEGASAVALDGLDDQARACVLEAYRQGFRAALVAVGLGFGLEPAGGDTVRRADKGPATALPAWVETQRE